MESLSETERRALLILKKPLGAKELGEELGIGKGVFRLIVELKEKGLIQTEEKTWERYSLTELGKKYVKAGLPERRLLRAVVEHKSLNKAAEHARLSEKELEAALGVLKELNAVEVEAGNIYLSEEGKGWLKKLIPAEEVVQFVAEGRIEELEKRRELVQKLVKRGIIEIRKEREVRVRLSRLGKELLPKLERARELIAQLTPELIIGEKWRGAEFKPYDIKAPPPPLYGGKLHPYLNFLDWVKDKLVSMGFKEMKGPLVEMSFFNCDALFIPQDHPAREIHDIYYIKEPKYGDLKGYEQVLERVAKAHERSWGYEFDKKVARRLLLRSHNTAISARMLLSKELRIPGKYFAIARCYRPDIIDPTHLTEFNQVEGIIVAPNLNFRHLLGVLKTFAIEIARAEKYRFAPAYFPMTEPSVELHVYKRKAGWVEVGGAGMFRPELRSPLGIKEEVIAWGLGIDRLYMIKEGISDIRELFTRDISKLR